MVFRSQYAQSLVDLHTQSELQSTEQVEAFQGGGAREEKDGGQAGHRQRRNSEVCAPFPRGRDSSKSHLLEEMKRRSIHGLPDSSQRRAPQPAPRKLLLQSRSAQTGSVGCLASSPREVWTSPKSFRSFLEQREAALTRRSRGPSLGSIHERSRTGTNECPNRPKSRDPSETRVDSSPNYKVLEQKVLDLQGQMKEMQMSRKSYEDSNARLAGFLSGFTSQLSLGGECGMFWDQEEVEEDSEEKSGSRRSFSAMPNQVRHFKIILPSRYQFLTHSTCRENYNVSQVRRMRLLSIFFLRKFFKNSRKD